MANRTGPRERTRQRVVRAAEAAAWQVGPSRTDLGQIAALAGVSRQTIYRYFGSKEELLESTADEAARAFAAGLDEATAEGTPLERLDAALGYVVAFQAQLNRSILQIDPGFALARLERSLPALRAAVLPLLAAARSAGTAPRGGPPIELVADLLVRTAVSHFLLTDDDGPTLHAALRLVAGLAADPPHPGSR